MSYLQIAIDKTAGPQTREALGLAAAGGGATPICGRDPRRRRGALMRMLGSVRSVADAGIAGAGGADFIELKAPRAGARWCRCSSPIAG